FTRAREALLAEWQTGRASAAAVLHGSGSLSRNRYSTKIRSRLIDAMDAFASASGAGFSELPEDLVKLSARELAASVNRGGARPRHAVFDRCDDLVAAWAASKASLEAWAQAFERELAQFVRRELPARARARGVLSFDDLLHDMQRALAGPQGN